MESTPKAVEGWVESSDEMQRHYYYIEPDMAAKNGLCGRGAAFTRAWVARHGSQNHQRADNCYYCEKKRLKINRNAKVD